MSGKEAFPTLPDTTAPAPPVPAPAPRAPAPAPPAIAHLDHGIFKFDRVGGGFMDVRYIQCTLYIQSMFSKTPPYIHGHMYIVHTIYV